MNPLYLQCQLSGHTWKCLLHKLRHNRTCSGMSLWSPILKSTQFLYFVKSNNRKKGSRFLHVSAVWLSFCCSQSVTITSTRALTWYWLPWQPTSFDQSGATKSPADHSLSPYHRWTPFTLSSNGFTCLLMLDSMMPTVSCLGGHIVAAPYKHTPVNIQYI